MFLVLDGVGAVVKAHESSKVMLIQLKCLFVSNF